MTPNYDMSIAISSFNRDDKVGQTLETLFRSDLSRFERVEVIVVDDGSPRPVADVLERVGTPPEKMDLRLVRHENSGIGATRNRGFREAKAGLVLFLDDDILVKPTTLNEFVDAHREHPGGVIFGSYPFISHESESLHRFARELYGYDRITAEPAYERVDAITSGLLCVDKSKLGEMKSFYRDDMTIPAAEEHEIIYRFHKLGVPIFNALHITAMHNHHLGLNWLVEQQYKYGLGTAEAFLKYPEIVSMKRFAGMSRTLRSIGNGGGQERIKAIFASSGGRKFLRSYSLFLEKLMPRKEKNRLFGLLASAYFWAGYADGDRLFSRSP